MGLRPFLVGSLLTVAIAAAVLSTIQRTTQSVPPWSIQFVDQLDRPFVGLRVQQYWQDYSLEESANFATETTNESGIAVFPARYLRASLLDRLLGPLESFLFRGGIHAGYGAHSNVLPKCNLRVRGPVLAIMLDGKVPNKAILSFLESGVARTECAKHEAQAYNADRLVKNSP